MDVAYKTKLKINNQKPKILRKIALFLLLFLIFFKQISFASSSYVLPYPSTMPGSIFYKIHLAEEVILKYWYFGNFGQFFYNLKESDKYLVEAKTLFEYNQYLLGFKALQKSNTYFENILPYLGKAQKEGRDINQNMQLFKQASQKHVEVLEYLKNNAPAEFNWSPEKSPATNLQIQKLIEESIKIRKNTL
jgi:hypothetical protein